MNSVRWSDVTLTPDDDALQTLRASWDWSLGENWSPLLFSIWGDVFLRLASQVYWLNTGTGELALVSDNEAAFRESLTSDRADRWFLPGLVAALHETGKRPGHSECFTYAIYPIFAEGRYEIENFTVVPAREHFGVSGDLHRQLSNLPEGAQIQLVFEP